LDEILTKLKLRIQVLDHDILNSVQKQSKVGLQSNKDLEEAKSAIKSLFEKIQGIKKKAEESEQMVEEITKDIKHLDNAKNNLESTINAINKLKQMEVSMTQLTSLSNERSYTNVGSLLSVFDDLDSVFGKFEEMSKIKDLRKKFDTVKNNFKTMIKLDIKNIDNLKTEKIKEICTCVDSLDTQFKAEVINYFIELQIIQFEKDTRSNDDYLEGLIKRYNWLRNKIKDLDETYIKDNIFPKNWFILQELTVEFCLKVREKVLNYLKEKNEKLNSLVLNNSLLTTLS
jgi:vacuolar protein sorting-associated protein 53